MKELIKQFNLPDYIMGAKSFSEASTMIMKKFNEREDPTSKRTMSDMMGRLRDAQEYIKAQVEPQPAPQEQLPQPGEQSVNEDDMNQFNLGGLFTSLLGGAGGGGATGAPGGGGIASQVAPMAGKLVESFGRKDDLPDPTTAGISGALSGAANGASAGPIGAIGGAVIGGLTGAIGAGRAKKQLLDSKQVDVQSARSAALNTYAGGGIMNTFPELAPVTPQPRGHDVNTGFDNTLASTTPIGIQEGTKPSFLNRLGNKASELGNTAIQGAQKVGEFAKDNTSLLRYAPTAINAIQAANLERPGVTKLDRLDARYKPQYADEQALQNIAREQFNTSSEAISGASGGSTSAARSNILGAGLNRARSISDAYQRAAAANRGEDRTAQQFNLGVDKANMGQANLETDINARDQGAYETQKAGSIKRLGQDLGSIGKEEAQQDIIKRLFGYDKKGKYINKRRPKAKRSGAKARGPKLTNTPFNPLSLNLTKK